jgi:hypothetical protein
MLQKGVKCGALERIPLKIAPSKISTNSSFG